MGAAVMWAAPTQSFKDLGDAPSPPSTRVGWWNYQLIRAKMFHNLINNEDPNLGNWLVDPAWNIILIDNSRAFTTGSELVHEFARVDRELWDRLLALDEAALDTALGQWLTDGEIRGILRRRDVMAEKIEQMVGSSQGSVQLWPVPWLISQTLSSTYVAGEHRLSLERNCRLSENPAHGTRRKSRGACQFQGAEQSARVRPSGKTSAKVQAAFHECSWFVAL